MKKNEKKYRKVQEGKIDMVVLCGGGTCCPTIDLSNTSEIVLRDDFGGMVRLNPEQYQGLKDYIASINNK